MKEIKIIVGSGMDVKRLAASLAFDDALQHNQYSVRAVCLDKGNQKNALAQSIEQMERLKVSYRTDVIVSFGEEVISVEDTTYIHSAVIVCRPSSFLSPWVSRLLLPPNTVWHSEREEPEFSFLRTMKICLYRETITKALRPHLQYLL